MPRKIIIVGAGIIGAAIAHALRDHDVIVVDAGPMAGGASGRSFGWVNASFFADEAHHRLRAAALSAWREIPHMVTWSGCLWWEEQGAGLAAMQAKLSSLGYPVQRLNRDEIAMREPAIVPPQEALLFPDEGVAEAGDVTRRLLEASGAKVMLGSRVEALVHNHRGIKGVRLAQGDLEADQVIVAAGTGAEALLSSADVPLPMVHRPALLVCTKPVDITLTHVLVGPHGELRQLPDGRLLIPAAVNHQGVTAQGVGRPDRVADATMDRLRPFLPGRALDWETVVHAARPVPKDGLPVIGRAADGLYVAVMHSGVTLAALTGALVAEELEGRLSNLLGPYRPQRF